MKYSEKQKLLAKYKKNKNMTYAEMIMEEILKDWVGVKKYMKEKGFMAGLDTFVIADFYLPKPYKIVIEVDGLYHNNQPDYDKFKDEYYKSRGFTVLRFPNYDVLHNRQYVREKIQNTMWSIVKPKWMLI